MIAAAKSNPDGAVVAVITGLAFFRGLALFRSRPFARRRRRWE